MATIVTRSGKGAPLSIAEGDSNFTNLNNDKIELTDLSVSTGAASGAGALSYNNTTGVFTFNPVDTSLVLIDLIDDTSPQLGGDLDVLTNKITTSTTNGNIAVEPNGTGIVLLNSQVRINGNLDVQNHTITTSTTDGDVNISANGTGSVVLDGDSLVVPQSVSNPNGNIFLEPVSAGTVDVKADTLLVGESSSSTEALITGAAGSNANLKIRAAGTGTIILDDATEINGNFDIKSHSITTSTTNGLVEITNNGTGSTRITGGSGLGISSGYIAATDTNADLTLSANGTGAIVLNQAGAVVVTDTAASGFGVITGATSKGISLLTNAGANAGTDPTFSLTSGGGASLTAGSGSTLTLSGNAVSVTGTTTLNDDTDINSLNNFVHALAVETSVSGTITPDASTGNVKYVVPSGNITINDFASGSIVPGQTITMLIDQSTYSTSYTLTLGAKFLVPGGTALTLTASGNDLLSLMCLDDGSSSGNNVYIANIVNDYQ